VLNTADIGDFCIVGMKSAGSGTRTLTAVTGDCATSAHQEGCLMSERVAALRAEVESICTSDVLLHQVHDIFYIVTNSCYTYVVYTGTLLSLQLQCNADTLMSLKLQYTLVLCCHFSYSVMQIL
jgi:hypothetical protein